MKKWTGKYQNPLKPFFPAKTKPRYIAIDTLFDLYIGESDNLGDLREKADEYSQDNWYSEPVIYDRYNEKQVKALKEMGWN
jgi:hypothetical protein